MHYTPNIQGIGVYNITPPVDGILPHDGLPDELQGLTRAYALGVTCVGFDGSPNSEDFYSNPLWPLARAVSRLRDVQAVALPMDEHDVFDRMRWGQEVGNPDDEEYLPSLDRHVVLCERPVPDVGRALAYVALREDDGDLVASEVAVGWGVPRIHDTARSLDVQRPFSRLRVTAALFQAVLQGSSYSAQQRMVVARDAPSQAGKEIMEALGFTDGYDGLGNEAFVTSLTDLGAKTGDMLGLRKAADTELPA